MKYVMIMILMIMIMLTCLRKAHSSAIVPPDNRAVIAGDRMAMQCQVANGSRVFEWKLNTPVAAKKDTIVNIRNGKTNFHSTFRHFGANVDEHGSGLIYTNSTKVTDAGLYWCYVEDEDENEIQYSAQLIVLESAPVCKTNYVTDEKSTNVDGDHIWMRCNVNFTGLWNPAMEWRQHTIDGNVTEYDEEKVIKGGVVTVMAVNSSIRSTLTFHHVSISSATYFSCKLYFTRISDIIDLRNMATNIPDFVYIWNSPIITPSNIWTPKLAVSDDSSPPPFLGTVEIPTGTGTKPAEWNWYIVPLVPAIIVLSFVSMMI